MSIYAGYITLWFIVFFIMIASDKGSYAFANLLGSACISGILWIVAMLLQQFGCLL